LRWTCFAAMGRLIAAAVVIFLPVDCGDAPDCDGSVK
jgi:hypothetical protein